MPEDNGKFIYYLNESLEESDRIFKLKDAVLDDDTLTIRLMYPAEYADKLTVKLKTTVQIYARATVPEVFDTKIEYIRTYTDESTVRTVLMEFLYKEAVLVYPKLKDSEPKFEFQPFLVKISFPVPSYVISYCSNSGLKEKIENNLSNNFIEDFEIEFLSVEETIILGRGERERHKETLKTIEIKTELDQLHHGRVSRLPRYICDVVSRESEVEVVCGTISNFRKIDTKDKTRSFYVFRVDDTTGKIDVKFFPSLRAKDIEKVYEKFDKLKNGDKIAVEGSIRMDNFTKANAMSLKNFAICTIDFKSITRDIEYLGLPSEYFRCFPKPYEDTALEAVDIFHMNDEMPEALRDKTYVIFDFETTGLMPGTDSPIEIGAVKIVNGTMVETFSSLIQPIFRDGRSKLGDEISNLTGITDEMLLDAPRAADIAGDVYRFFHGATLVAHNADFDMAFLKKFGDDNYYNFDNESIDTIRLSRERTSYGKHNLGFLCEKMGIDLKNAHRAVNDAVATAKLFLKLVRLPILRGKH